MRHRRRICAQESGCLDEGAILLVQKYIHRTLLGKMPPICCRLLSFKEIVIEGDHCAEIIKTDPFISSMDAV
jgi:hypothetical protein